MNSDLKHQINQLKKQVEEDMVVSRGDKTAISGVGYNMVNNGNEGTLQENVAVNDNVRLPRNIRKPLAFQNLGEAIWEDMEPQSHRAQHPWLLAHTRETKDTVKEVMQSIIDPQVINLFL